MTVQTVAMREFTDSYRSKIRAQVWLKSIFQVNRWRFNQMSTDNWCVGGWGANSRLVKSTRGAWEDVLPQSEAL